uniref:Uncharacterized protein n=1 Tax=Anguilla anguilla TaxID=7936 RepID=A0A0E9U613_ANGAN
MCNKISLGLGAQSYWLGLGVKSAVFTGDLLQI